MSGAYVLNFFGAIENGNLSVVQSQLLSGNANANMNYLGVYPLTLAIEQGNVDMCALLLTAGADPKKKANTAKHNAETLVQAMRDDPKHKFRIEANMISQLMSDKEALKARFDEVQLKISKENNRDLKRAVALFALFLGIFVPYLTYEFKLWSFDGLL